MGRRPVIFRLFSLCFGFDRIAPAMLRQASYGTIKIGTYQSLKRLFVERPEGETIFQDGQQWAVCLLSGCSGADFLQLLVT